MINRISLYRISKPPYTMGSMIDHTPFCKVLAFIVIYGCRDIETGANQIFKCR